MNSNVHPAVAVLVILLTIVAVGVWMWASGEAASIGGPAELRASPDGHLYVQFQNKLIEHDGSGRFVATHDLAELGVDLFLGGYAFFSNGDVLLRRGPDPRTFADNVRAFQRKTNQLSLEPDTPDTGLYRCDLQEKSCTSFGVRPIDFKAVISIHIDWETDDVYVADTTRHALRKYASDGEQLAGPVGGCRFPNQLLLNDEKLLVADTNHHVVRIVDARSASFGRDLGRKAVVPAQASAAGQTWPSHFARVGHEWWVNNMRSGMNEGGLFIFDQDWRYQRRAVLPRGADPISILAFGEEVLVSDWNNDRVYRLSKAGDLLPDFSSSGLKNLVLSAQERRSEFEVYKFLGVGLFALLLGGLMVRALAVKMSAG